MLRKFVCAAVVVVIGLSVVAAEEFGVLIKKVEGDKVSYTKKGKKGAPGVDGSADVAKDVKVVKGKFNKDTKKVEEGDAVADGLKNEMFSKIDAEKGVGATITVDDTSKKITKIIIVGGKKKAAN